MNSLFVADAVRLSCSGEAYCLRLAVVLSVWIMAALFLYVGGFDCAVVLTEKRMPLSVWGVNRMAGETDR